MEVAKGNTTGDDEDHTKVDIADDEVEAKDTIGRRR